MERPLIEVALMNCAQFNYLQSIAQFKKEALSTINLKYATKTGSPVSVAPAQTKKSRQNLQTATPGIFDHYKFSNIWVLLKFELVLFRLLDQEQVQSKAYCNSIDFFHHLYENSVS